MTVFKKGTTVRWSSQARGQILTKTGRILCRVPADTPPVIYQRRKGSESKVLNPDLKGVGMATFEMNRISVNRTRSEPSYLVAVKQPGSTKDILYWPRIQDLKEVK